MEYRHTAPNGTTYTRKSNRTYTHVIVAHGDDKLEDGAVLAWAGSARLAMQRVKDFGRRGMACAYVEVNGGTAPTTAPTTASATDTATEGPTKDTDAVGRGDSEAPTTKPSRTRKGPKDGGPKDGATRATKAGPLSMEDVVGGGVSLVGPASGGYFRILVDGRPLGYVTPRRWGATLEVLTARLGGASGAQLEGTHTRQNQTVLRVTPDNLDQARDLVALARASATAPKEPKDGGPKDGGPKEADAS